MTDQLPLYLETSDNTVRRVPGGDRIDPAALGLSGDPVGTSDTQTLSNKTLTAPKQSAIHEPTDNGKVLDFFTPNPGTASVNYVQIGNAQTGIPPLIQAQGADAVLNLQIRSKGVGSWVKINNQDAVTVNATQTLANKTLTTPLIGNFSNATHNHQNDAGGGKLTAASFVAGAGLSRVLHVATATSSAIANTTSGTAFDNMSLSAYMNDVLGAVGSTIRLTASGTFGATGTPTCRIRLVPSGTGVTFLWDSGAITMPAVTGKYWQTQVLLTTRAVGGSGVISAATLRDVRDTTVTQSLAYNGSFDFTTLGGILAQLELRVIWSVADPLNTITCEQLLVEALN